MKNRDLVLGGRPDATAAEIKAAYRAQALRPPRDRDGRAARSACGLAETRPHDGERLFLDLIERDGANPSGENLLGWLWATPVLGEASPEHALPLVRRAVLADAVPRPMRSAPRAARGKKRRAGAET